MIKQIVFILIFLSAFCSAGQNTSVKIALLKYGGGVIGTAIHCTTNLIVFLQRNWMLRSILNMPPWKWKFRDSQLSLCILPAGNVVFRNDARNLRLYMEAEACFIDDNFRIVLIFEGR